MRPMKARRRNADPDELTASAREETPRVFDEEGGARVVVGRRVVLCQSPADVETALAGRIPPGAVRLDGRAQG